MMAIILCSMYSYNIRNHRVRNTYCRRNLNSASLDTLLSWLGSVAVRRPVMARISARIDRWKKMQPI